MLTDLVTKDLSKGIWQIKAAAGWQCAHCVYRAEVIRIN
jgi:hypothetical protein